MVEERVRILEVEVMKLKKMEKKNKKRKARKKSVGVEDEWVRPCS